MTLIELYGDAIMAQLRDPIPPTETDYLLRQFPREPEHDISMSHLGFYAWLVLTGQLDGDTSPRERRMDEIEYAAHIRDIGVIRPSEMGPDYTG